MGLGRILWRDHGVGLILALGHLALLWQICPDVGVPRDESFYFHAADNAADWFDRLIERPRACKSSRVCGPGLGCVEGHCQPKTCTESKACGAGVECVEGKCEVRSLSSAEIDRGYKYNHEHPVLMKQLFGVSHQLLSEAGFGQDHRRLYRLPTMVMAALALWLTYLIGVLVAGRRAGFFAALALAWMPRVVFHSNLAAFDGPVMFMWLLVVYTFLRGTRSRMWAVLSGLALGLGFATKLNIFFLPFLLLIVAFIDLWAFKRRTGRWKAMDGARGPLTYYGWMAPSMLLLGAAVFFFHWPWLWADFSETWPRLKFYVGFHARHVHYPVDYLGTLYFKPPFPIHFPFVFSALTIPVAILAPAVIGFFIVFGRAWRQLFMREQADRQGHEAAILANLIFPFALIALPMTPIFGGTKHWMTAMPFLAILAGIGLVRIADGLFRGAELWARWTVSLTLLLPALWATFAYSSQGPAYFNSVAGVARLLGGPPHAVSGPPAAAELRMPRNFWGHSTLSVLDDVNERAPTRGLVFWHKATRGAIDAYKRDGLLREDLQYTGDWTAEYSDWAVYHDQKEKEPEELDIWRAYGTDWPVAGEFLDGVQLMAVYQRPGTRTRLKPKPAKAQERSTKAPAKRAPAPVVDAGVAAPAADAAPAPLADAAPTPALDAAVAAEVDAAAEVTPAIDAAPAPVMDAAVAPVVDAAIAPAVDAVIAPAMDAAPAPVVDAAPEPVMDAAPVVDATPTPVVDAAVEPTVDAAPVEDAAPVVDAAVEPVADAAPVADATPVIDATPDPVVDAAPVIDATPEVPVPDVIPPKPADAAPVTPRPDAKIGGSDEIIW